MKIEDIKTRIEKKEVQIAKIQRRLDKWLAKCTDEEKELAATFRDKTYAEWSRYCKENNIGIYNNPADEARRAYQDLDEATAQLEKYNSLLAGAEEKANTEKIPAIVTFLDKWKENAADYVRKNMSILQEYKLKDREYTKLYNERWGHRDDEEYMANLKAVKTRLIELRPNIHPWTVDCCKNVYEKDPTYGWDILVGCEVNEETLAKLLDEEAENKYWELVNRIQSVAGNIVDVSGLRIGPKGNIEGLVIGDRETVHVETIVAGGWNTGRIVNVRRGPICHYRTLVNVVRR